MPDYVERDEWKITAVSAMICIFLLLVGLSFVTGRLEGAMRRIEKLEQVVQSK